MGILETFEFSTVELFLAGLAFAVLALILSSRNQAQVNAVINRAVPPQAPLRPEDLRTTDRRKLSRSELKIKAQADELAVQNRPKEAAQLYCDIKVHRLAVSCWQVYLVPPWLIFTSSAVARQVDGAVHFTRYLAGLKPPNDSSMFACQVLQKMIAATASIPMPSHGMRRFSFML
jgi:hypothetical protein